MRFSGLTFQFAAIEFSAGRERQANELSEGCFTVATTLLVKKNVSQTNEISACAKKGIAC